MDIQWNLGFIISRIWHITQSPWYKVPWKIKMVETTENIALKRHNESHLGEIKTDNKSVE